MAFQGFRALRSVSQLLSAYLSRSFSPRPPLRSPANRRSCPIAISSISANKLPGTRMLLLATLASSSFLATSSPGHGAAAVPRTHQLVLKAETPASALPYAQLASVTAGGDATMLLLFAAIGRGNHNTDDGSVLLTAAPFLLSWALIAPWLGAYKPADTRTEALIAPLPSIAVTVPLGCALRGVLQGYQPPLPFWIVAIIATTVLLESWRAAYFQVSAHGPFVPVHARARRVTGVHMTRCSHGRRSWRSMPSLRNSPTPSLTTTIESPEAHLRLCRLLLANASVLRQTRAFEAERDIIETHDADLSGS